MNPSTSYFLNASRWIAALLVLVGHVKNLILVDYPLVEHQSADLKALYFVTGFGHEAVVVFFVISGFLVGGLTLEKWQQKGADIHSFMVARVSRIYTVFIPAVAIGVALDSIGLSLFNASELYTNATQFHTGSIPDSVGGVNLSTVIGNLFMLQTIAVETVGSNGPLWSLANEWWYYCIFACVGFAVYGNGRPRIALAFMAILLGVVLPIKITLWALIWAMGVAIPVWIKSRLWRPHPALGLGILVLAFAFSRQSHGLEIITGRFAFANQFLKDLALGLCYAAALGCTSRITIRLPFSRMHHWLAEFSFTTYLFHFPLMLFLVSAGFQLFGWSFKRQPDVSALTYLLAMVMVVFGLCYLISLVTERHTNFVRNWLGKVLHTQHGLRAS